jgi:predicted enzyme related to lactoylglutathione lyase
MTERTSYAPGTPSWVDLGSPDPAATAAFYGGLFGWEVAMDPRPEAGGYGLFSLHGHPVAGVGPQTDAGAPPFWAVYVTVDDVDASLAKAEAEGGTVVAGPIEVLEAGRMGIVQDPVGSVTSVWQPREHIGAELVNEPGTFTWNELATSDVAAARAFYRGLFGWGVSAGGDGGAEGAFTVGDEMVCGAHAAGEGEPPGWSVWFAVDDCDASAARATELGATVLVPPNDMDFGRGAVLADPQGAMFGIGAMAG